MQYIFYFNQELGQSLCRLQDCTHSMQTNQVYRKWLIILLQLSQHNVNASSSAIKKKSMHPFEVMGNFFVPSYSFVHGYYHDLFTIAEHCLW